jgi:hypothetical protein
MDYKRNLWKMSCPVLYIYRSLEYLSIMLRYSGLFGLVCNSPVQGQVITEENIKVWVKAANSFPVKIQSLSIKRREGHWLILH